MLVIHITPQLPPAVCGVGDYATLVGRRMEELDPRVWCAWVACGHRAVAPTSEGVDTCRRWATCHATGLWDAVESLAAESAEEDVALVLHYSGYGYEPGGAPAWLAEAVERRPAPLAAWRLVTVFHELYATGWPWQRAYWSSRRQQAVAARIARASDAMVTNREQSARWVEQQAGLPQGSVPRLVVCSNVGERDVILPWDDRLPTAVLFGGASFKAPFLAGRGAGRTLELCRRLAIDTIFDIGAAGASDDAAFDRAGIHVERTGYLPASEVERRLANARLALVDYYPGYFAKSGVLAAVAAHGAPPVMLRRDGASDGLAFGEHIWSLDALLAMNAESARARLRTASEAIWGWYRSHSVAHHAELLVTTCALSRVAAC